MMSNASYEHVATLFQRYELFPSPTEADGLIAALICQPNPTTALAEQLAHWLHEGQPLPEEVQSALDQRAQALYHALSEHTPFELYLPNDEAPWQERIEGLSHWAQSFLIGLSLALEGDTPPSTALADILEDIQQIVLLQEELASEDAEAEEAIEIVYEHLKLGLMIAFEEHNKVRSGTPTLH